MRRNPLYVFKDENSAGIYNIPLHSVVQILQTSGGRVLVVELISKEGLNIASTIGELLNNPDLYNILSDGTPGGELVKFREGHATGYKLIDSDASEFGSVGLDSVDFSFQTNSTTNDGGATSEYSFCTGLLTQAGGPRTAAFGYLSKAHGRNSFASGHETQAQGITSFASGRTTQALGDYSTTSGFNTIANARASTASGYRTLASGEASSAEGVSTIASAAYSHAEGNLTVAGGVNSHSEGDSTQAGGKSSHAEGGETISGGIYSHAEGLKTNAEGMVTHTEGHYTTASGHYSHAEGLHNEAEGEASHVEGSRNVTLGARSHAEGYRTFASGDNSHAEGYRTNAIGNNSHAEGLYSVASGDNSHAGGYSTQANGECSSALGSDTIAQGRNSFVSGQNNQTQGTNTFSTGKNNFSILEGTFSIGYNTRAESPFSSTEGGYTTTLGIYSKAIGYQNIAENDHEFVLGRFNAPAPDALMVVGAGTSGVRRNVFEVYDTGILTAPVLNTFDWNVISDDTLITKKFLMDSHDEFGNGLTSQLEKIAESGLIGWRLLGRDPDKYGDIGFGAVDLMNSTTDNTTRGATGNYSITTGVDTTASAVASNARGTLTEARGISSSAEGMHAIANGEASHAEGYQTIADGQYSHAEGKLTSARGEASAASGYQTIAEGTASTASGYQTISRGNFSYSGGYRTIAGGENSFASGSNNNVNGLNSAVFGSNSTVEKDSSFVAGENNLVDGARNIVLGSNCTSMANDAFIIGKSCTTNQPDVYMIGSNLNTITANFTALGYYNLGINPNNILEVGIGSPTQRANALEINTDGIITTPEATTLEIDAAGPRTLVTKEFVQNQIGYFERVQENGVGGLRYGYRIKFRDPNAYGITGVEGVDLSFSTDTSNLGFGTTGNYAFCSGYNVEAAGLNSNAGNYSTHALGENSHAEGYCAVAIGDNSHAEGHQTIAPNEDMHAAGRYNIGTGGTIHETGIGIDDTNRSNAFEIYLDGRLHAPEQTIALHDTPRSMVTVEYLEDRLNTAIINIKLGDLYDVSLNSTIDEEAITYNASGEIWENTLIESGCETGLIEGLNFDATYDQTEFIIPDPVIQIFSVTIDGILLRDTEYNVLSESTETTVILNQGSDEDSWVRIQYYSGGEYNTTIAFDAGINQSDYVIQGQKAITMIYMDGILIRDNQYVVNSTSTETTVTFNDAPRERAWIQIFY